MPSPIEEEFQKETNQFGLFVSGVAKKANALSSDFQHDADVNNFHQRTLALEKQLFEAKAALLKEDFEKGERQNEKFFSAKKYCNLILAYRIRVARFCSLIKNKQNLKEKELLLLEEDIKNKSWSQYIAEINAILAQAQQAQEALNKALFTTEAEKNSVSKIIDDLFKAQTEWHNMAVSIKKDIELLQNENAARKQRILHDQARLQELQNDPSVNENDVRVVALGVKIKNNEEMDRFEVRALATLNFLLEKCEKSTQDFYVLSKYLENSLLSSEKIETNLVDHAKRFCAARNKPKAQIRVFLGKLQALKRQNQALETELQTISHSADSQTSGAIKKTLEIERKLQENRAQFNQLLKQYEKNNTMAPPQNKDLLKNRIGDLIHNKLELASLSSLRKGEGLENGKLYLKLSGNKQSIEYKCLKNGKIVEGSIDRKDLGLGIGQVFPLEENLESFAQIEKNIFDVVKKRGHAFKGYSAKLAALDKQSFSFGGEYAVPIREIHKDFCRYRIKELEKIQTLLESPNLSKEEFARLAKKTKLVVSDSSPESQKYLSKIRHQKIKNKLDWTKQEIQNRTSYNRGCIIKNNELFSNELDFIQKTPGTQNDQIAMKIKRGVEVTQQGVGLALLDMANQNDIEPDKLYLFAENGKIHFAVRSRAAVLEPGHIETGTISGDQLGVDIDETISDPNDLGQYKKIEVEIFDHVRKKGIYHLDGIDRCQKSIEKRIERELNGENGANKKLVGMLDEFESQAPYLSPEAYEEWNKRIDTFSAPLFVEICRTVQPNESYRVKVFVAKRSSPTLRSSVEAPQPKEPGPEAPKPPRGKSPTLP